MDTNTSTKKSKPLAGVVIALVVLVGIFLMVQKKPVADTNNPSPTPPDETTSWKTANDTINAITFKHPADFGMTYIKPQDWPPVIQRIGGLLPCTESGTATARAGKTQKKTISGRDYCVTDVVEGAAGSTYTEYAYALPYGSGSAAETLILTFTTKMPQCANYDEPKQTECKTEQASFSIDSLVGKIVETLIVGDKGAGLPEAVRTKMTAILAAARAKNYNSLGSLASSTIKYSFGENKPNGFVPALKALEKNGVNPFATIERLLSLPYAVQGNYYVWPSVFAKSADEWTPADIAQMKTFLTDTEIEGFRKFGAYAGYRIGIDKTTGDWMYFVAGD